MLNKSLLLILLIKILSVLSKKIVTNSGTIEGYINTSFSKRKFLAFEGIPYAKPPIGDNRFREPQSIENLDNSLHQANFLSKCPQFENNLVSGTEDCLHLNIYVPRDSINSSSNFDVIVHIHGGGFMTGSSHEYTSPGYFMDHDIIFVTFNYRLGILGFLSTEDTILPGNNGLKDQLLALQWIKNNIRHFGGNPNSITLSGVSAGGASVHLHYFSQKSRGLFHRGFSRSGCALNSWVFQTQAAAKAKILGAAVNCSFNSSDGFVKCLRKRDYLHIIDQTKLFYKFKNIPIAPFGPVVEKGNDAFLAEEPYQLLLKKQVQNLPWLASFVRDDAEPLLSEFRNKLEDLDLNWTKIAPFLLHYNNNVSEENWPSVGEKIRDEYFGKNGKISKDSFRTLVKLLTERITVSGVAKSGKLQSEVSDSAVYLYNLSYTGDTKNVVEHYDDNKYFYYRNGDNLSQNELKMKDLLVKMLLTYTKTGKPTIDDVNWPPVEPNKIHILHILGFQRTDLKLEVEKDLGNTRFW